LDKSRSFALVPLTIPDIIPAFPKKAQRFITMPKLEAIDWRVLDYYGWCHSSGHLGYVIFNDKSGIRGIVLEKTKMTGAQKPRMCSWCLTVHRGCGVNLFTSATAYDKNKIIGEYVCSNLNCSLYISGLLVPDACQMRENIGMDAKKERLRANVGKFFDMIYSQKM
jgi:hypothetical protein